MHTLQSGSGTLSPTVEVLEVGSGALVRLAGEFDLSAAAVLRDRLVALCASLPTRVTIDLSAVTFLDAVTMGLLAATFRRLRANGTSVALVAVSPWLAKVLRIGRLGSLIPGSSTVQLEPAEQRPSSLRSTA